METPLTHAGNPDSLWKPLSRPPYTHTHPECVCVQTKALVTVGKMLKKNNVAADVVSMGETDDNQVRDVFPHPYIFGRALCTW